MVRLLATSLMAAGLVVTFASQNGQAADVKRTPLEIRKSVEVALERETAAVTTAERTAAVRELAALAKELADHPTMARSAVGSLQGRIKARLERMQARLAKAGKAAPKIQEPKGDRNNILAQVPPGGAAEPKKPDQGIPQLTEDTGEALAQLIRETVAADTWVENGGNGVIVYFPSLRALVVHQAGEAHEGLADLIGQLHP